MTPDPATEHPQEAVTRPSRFKKYKKKARHWLSKLLVLLIRQLNRADLKLTGYYYEEKKTGYQDLGPTLHASNNEVYDESLLWGMKNKHVTNLAVTGPYGSGKSSVIATFQAKHKEFRFLNISLATFAEENKENLAPDWRQKVELSILQQLIYHVKNSKLPDSRFKKINHTSRLERFFVTLVLMILGLCIFYIYKPEYFAQFSKWKELEKGRKDIFTYCALGYFLVAASILVYQLYRTVKAFRFNKIGLSNGEIELAEKDDKSIFNKHLDEIIYFFQVTKYDVILIEDLDRFDDAEIFTKLREVNNLVNNSRQVGRRVIFLYAVRDDMFKDKDRAKFFDFIVPVIPVINTSNAGDELRDQLRVLSLENPISNKFLNTVTLYIQDMRLLINVINEFRVYLNQIGKNLDPEKLLSIIVYKNLYPEDFAKLHNQEGDVYDFIHAKYPFIKESIAVKEAEERIEQEKITSLKSVFLKNVRELRSVYITALFEHFPANASLKIGSNDRTVKELLGDAGFNELTSAGQLRYKYFRSNYNPDEQVIDKTFRTIEKEVNPELTYKQRLAQLNEIAEGEIAKARNRITAINRQKADIQGYTIEDIISKEPGFTIPDKFAENHLLTFLISEGFIDEHYPTYISFFIEGSLSQGDMDFVNAVAQKKPLPVDHKLTNIQTISDKWLSINSYGQRAILNIQFVDYLVRQERMTAETERLITQLDYSSEFEKSFIIRYLGDGAAQDEFIRLYCAQWPDFWDSVYDDAMIEPFLMDSYLLLILKNVSLPNIRQLDKSKKLAEYIAAKPGYLSFVKPLNQPFQIKEIISTREIEFLKLESRDVLPEVFDFIYREDHYKISLENIQTIFRAYPASFEGFREEQLLTENFTVIRGSDATELDEYIEANLERYVTDVLLRTDTNTNESGESLTILLQYEGLPTDLKLELIKKQHNQIEALSPVPQSIYTALISGNKVEANWGNVMEYFRFTKMLNEALIGFLNIEDNLDELTKEDWYQFFEDAEIEDDLKADAENFEKLLMTCEGLSQGAYEQMVDYSFYYYSNLDLSGLSESKVKYLIGSSTFKFSKESTDSVINQFPNLAVSYLIKNHEEYFKLEAPPLLNDEQYAGLLNQEDCGSAIKIKALNLLTAEELQKRPAMLPLAARFLIRNNSTAQPTREFVKLFTGMINDTELKMDLLVNFDPILDAADIKELLAGFPKPFSELREIRSKPVAVRNVDGTEPFLRFLSRKLDSVISSISPDRKKNGFKVNFRRK